MLSKTAAAFAFVLLAFTTRVMASDEIATTTAVALMPVTAAVEAAAAAPVASTSAIATASEGAQSLSLMTRPGVSGRGTLLPALYGGLAALNAYDAYTTVKGLSHGATEANGVMGKAAGSPTAMWAIKGTLTASSILLAEHLWRTHRRGEAIGMMLVTNGVMALVGVQNTSVLRSQR